MKKVLITSGGTREAVDSVRVMTNISSGKLGAKIAETFIEANYPENFTPLHAKKISVRIPEDRYEVYYLHTKTAVMPKGKPTVWDYRLGYADSTEKEYSCNSRSKYLHRIEVNSVNDVYAKMEELVPEMDAVVNCAAISDFTFNRDNPVKLKSSDAEGFIEYMRANIGQSPKIINKIKEWNPEIFLVGFKFEVGLSERELVKLARESMNVYNGDIIIANDKAQMQKYKEHIAYLIHSGKKEYQLLEGKPAIAKAIFSEIDNYFKLKEGLHS